MARQKGGLKRAERRQPEPSPIVISDADAAPRSTSRPVPPVNVQGSAIGSKTKAGKKRGSTSKAENRAKVQRAIENADRLQMKSAKRASRDEKRKRAKE